MTYNTSRSEVCQDSLKFLAKKAQESAGCPYYSQYKIVKRKVIILTLGHQTWLESQDSHNDSVWIMINSLIESCIKGTISDRLRLRKIFKPFRNKEKYLSITTCNIVSKKNHIDLTEKWIFIRLNSLDPEHCFPEFKEKLRVSLSIKHINPQNNKVILLKKCLKNKYCCSKWKYINTSENQDWNFLLESLAYIN